jgi:hypothetical protein
MPPLLMLLLLLLPAVWDWARRKTSQPPIKK